MEAGTGAWGEGEEGGKGKEEGEERGEERGKGKKGEGVREIQGNDKLVVIGGLRAGGRGLMAICCLR